MEFTSKFQNGSDLPTTEQVLENSEEKSPEISPEENKNETIPDATEKNQEPETTNTGSTNDDDKLTSAAVDAIGGKYGDSIIDVEHALKKTFSDDDTREILRRRLNIINGRYPYNQK